MNDKKQAGGWYYLTDSQRAFVLDTLAKRFPEDALRDTLALYDSLRNKHAAPDDVMSESDQAVGLIEVEPAPANGKEAM